MEQNWYIYQYFLAVSSPWFGWRAMHSENSPPKVNTMVNTRGYNLGTAVPGTSRYCDGKENTGGQPNLHQ